MIDFDALVLGPAMETFARPILIYPKDAGYAVYPARGIYSEQPIDIQVEGEGVMSSTIITLGVRLSECDLDLGQWDKIEIPASGSAASKGMFLIDDTDDDGQGGTLITLKSIRS